MKKSEKIKKYLKSNPLADKKRLAKKFNLSSSETSKILEEIKNDSQAKKSNAAVKNPQPMATKKASLFEQLNQKIFQTKFVYLFLFLLAILPRVFYFFKLNSFPELNIQILDAQYYADWAKQIAAGNVLGDKIFFTEPFYAYFLAALMKISANAFLLARILQTLLGALLPIVIFKISEKVFNRNIGIIAGIIVALYGPFIFYENLLLKTSLETFSLALFVWFFLTMLEKNSNRVYFLGGLLLGITALIKGNNLALLPVILLVISFSKKFATQKKIVLSAFFTLGILLIILPITIRNYAVGKDFVLTNYSFGIVTYQGNWWGADGSTAMVPSFLRPHPKYEEIDTQKMAEAYAGKSLTPSQISSFWVGKAIQESWSDPAHFLSTLSKKVLMIVNWHELSDDYSYDFYAKFTQLLRFLPSFLLICALGLSGMLLIFFSDDLKLKISKASNNEVLEISQRSKILLALTGGYVLVLLIANINSRYRIPLVPFFAIFAAVTLWYLWLKIKVRAKGTIFKISLLILFGIGLSVAPLQIYGAIKEDANANNQIGTYYLENKNYTEAKIYFEKTIAIDKNYEWAYKNLFLINMHAGDLAQAEDNIKNLILIRSDDLSNYDSLALLKKAQENSIDSIKDQLNQLLVGQQKVIYDPDAYEAARYTAAKDNDKTKEFLLKSLENYDNPPNSLISIAALKRSQGSNDEAIKYLSLAIEKNPYLLPARYNLANIYIEQKNYTFAIPQLKQIYDITPELGQTWSNLAIAYINTKNSSAAMPVVTSYIQRYKDDPTKKELVGKFSALLMQNK